MILSDVQIQELCVDHQMIAPYHPTSIRKTEDGVKILSIGQSSYGYDIGISSEPGTLMVFKASDKPVDPKNFDKNEHLEPAQIIKTEYGTAAIIPPNTTLLARSLEYIRMPADVTGVCLGKSTYARSGLTVLATPLEAKWDGHITLEIANVKPSPALVYLDEGFMQVLFLRGSPCNTTYADRGGKYQGQEGLTLPKM